MLKLTRLANTILLPLTVALPVLALDNIGIKRAEVPPAALGTAKYYAPGVTFTRYAYEDENGIRIYEFESHDSEGRHIEVDVLADGTLQEIEMEKHWDETPVAVQFELTIGHSGFIPTFIEASIRPDGTTVYEFEGIDKNGAFADYEILDNGPTVKLLAAW